LNDADGAPTAGAPTDPDRGDKPVVAIIEDQQAIAELLQEVLRDAGFRPVLVPSGSEAATAVRAVVPAVVLLDVMLPERSGWQILDELRADEATREVPVVVISAVYDRPGLHPLPAGGPIRFAAKPFDISGLVETVAALARPAEDPGT
jgi:DNA-binding response OmpR family regulator